MHGNGHDHGQVHGSEQDHSNEEDEEEIEEEQPEVPWSPKYVNFPKVPLLHNYHIPPNGGPWKFFLEGRHVKKYMTF